MINTQAKKEENDKINALLMQEPEYELIEKKILIIKALDNVMLENKKFIEEMQDAIKRHDAEKTTLKAQVMQLLLDIEAKTGYARAPRLAHLTETVETYEVLDEKACPAEFYEETVSRKLVKKRLIDAVKDGKVSKKSNWLKVNPSQKAVVIVG
jgi:hypothetical protein